MPDLGALTPAGAALLAVALLALALAPLGLVVLSPPGDDPEAAAGTATRRGDPE